MNKIWENYKKPTPVKWRKIGDFALLMLPVIQGGLLSAPNVTESQKYWIGFIASILIPAFKFWTNTQKDTEATQDIISSSHLN